MNCGEISSPNLLKGRNLSTDISALNFEVGCSESQIEPVISCDNKCDNIIYCKNRIYNENLVNEGINFKKNYIITSSIYENQTPKEHYNQVETLKIPELYSNKKHNETSEDNSCNDTSEANSCNEIHNRVTRSAVINISHETELCNDVLNFMTEACKSEQDTDCKTPSISVTDVCKPNSSNQKDETQLLVSDTQESHKRAEKGKKTFRCSECPWAFCSNVALRSHIVKTHQKKSSKVYTEGFKKRSQRFRKKSKKKAFQCPICKSSFRKAIELRAHIVAHSKETLQCKFCGLTFGVYNELKSHLLTHKRKPATCEICGKTFTQAGNMKTHLRTHTKEKPYTCERCGKQYAQSGDLTVHMRMHVEEKPFLCEVCGNLFYSLSHLSRHSKVHTREKPYTCQVCEKSFAHSHHLKKHYRIHTQEKPYMCEICGKAFSRADYLKQHIRVHTKEKPYICVICGKGFSQGGSLRLHQRVHTRQGISNSYAYTHDDEVPMSQFT